jgi:hypothetical protein
VGNTLTTAGVLGSKTHVSIGLRAESELLSSWRFCFFVVATPCAQDTTVQIQRLDPLESPSSFALGINNSGVVVGSFIGASSAHEGFIHEGGKYKAIVFPGFVGFTQASGINDTDAAVGEFTGSDHLDRGYLLTPAREVFQ